MHDDPQHDFRDALRAIGSGAAVFIVSFLLMFLPLLLGRNGFNKYIVAFAIIGAFAGLSFMLHGAVDRFRRRK